MNNTLKLWKALFGEDLTPNDCEIIGVESDGTLIYYNAEDGTCYNNGWTVDTVEDEQGKMNEREHIVTHPLQYVGLLRMHLKECFTPKSAKGMNKGREAWKRLRIEKINDIVMKATSADPHKYVSNLVKEAQYIVAKKNVEITPEQTMLQNEPMLVGKNGKTLSLAAFAKKCHVLSSNKCIPVNRGPGEMPMQRKFVVLFGRNEAVGKWKYYARLYCRTKHEALEKTMELVREHAMGRKSNLLVQGASEDFLLEAFLVNYNRRIPVAF